MSNTVVGLFNNYDQAEQAAREVKNAGLKTDDISIVLKHGNEHGNESNAKNDNISDGVVTGGMLGGVAGLLIGAGSMVVPGLGIIAAAGPITGLITGAITGGVAGGLIDLGIPEKSSYQYEDSVKSGKVLFSMKTDDEKISEIRNILNRNGVERVDSYH